MRRVTNKVFSQVHSRSMGLTGLAVAEKSKELVK